MISTSLENGGRVITILNSRIWATTAPSFSISMKECSSSLTFSIISSAISSINSEEIGSSETFCKRQLPGLPFFAYGGKLRLRWTLIVSSSK